MDFMFRTLEEVFLLSTIDTNAVHAGLATDLEDILKLLIVPECCLSSSILEIDCFHSAFAAQWSQQDDQAEDSVVHPMAVDDQPQRHASNAQPDTGTLQQKLATPGVMTVQGMAQCQLLLSCIMKLATHCLSRSPLLLTGSSMSQAMTSIRSLACHGGLQVPRNYSLLAITVLCFQ